MSPRTRIVLVVAVLAAAAAAATVAATVLIWGGDSHAARQSVGLRPGAPLYILDELGVRADPEAQRLRRAERLYSRGDRAAAGRLLGGDASLEARVGAALARWPRATITELDGLARAHPRSAFVRLHLGLALLWARRNAEARQAWRTAERVAPDSPSAVRAETLLHPQFAAAAALAPREPEARVAAAVGLFDKERPALAFSRLGPLSKTFPRAQTVRFHLGLLLLWIGQVQTAKEELRLAHAEGPKTLLGSEAQALLARLGH